MPSPEEVARSKRAAAALSRKAIGELDRFWNALDTASPEQARDGLIEFMEYLTGKYGDVSATLAADAYEQARIAADVPGPFTATTVPVRPKAVAGATRRLSGGLFTGDLDGIAAGLATMANRLIRGAGRQTTLGAVRADGARAARVPRLGSVCKFCVELGSRGFVYASEITAGKFNQFHNNCRCEIVVSWDRHPTLEGYDPDALATQLEQMRSLDPDTVRQAGTSNRGTAPRPRPWGEPADRSRVAHVKQHELDTAERLRHHGWSTVFQPETKSGRSADTWARFADGTTARVEYKSPKGSKERTIVESLRDGRGQSSWIVVDMARTPLGVDEVMRQVEQAAREYAGFDRVTVVTPENRLIDWRRA